MATSFFGHESLCSLHLGPPQTSHDLHQCTHCSVVTSGRCCFKLHVTRYFTQLTRWPIYGKSARSKNLAALSALILVSCTQQIINRVELGFSTPESMLSVILHTFYVLPKHHMDDKSFLNIHLHIQFLNYTFKQSTI